ncbi:PAS domain S-box protein [Telluribacter sp.]|jgi:PAS domain S-box-containing protein|uniref:PAS domain S-box protein n=1 Tax=Telluribacter sp. TaxID=1978767 RepID=UPI002E14533E|nr:PAS domain S-box protein [Telluribacter sp.]
MLSPKQSEELFNFSPVAGIILKPDEPVFTVVKLNCAFTQLLAGQEKQLTGQSFLEVFPVCADRNAGSLENLRRSLFQVLSTGTSQKLENHEYEVPAPGTDTFQKRYWTLTLHPIFNDQEEIQYISLSIVDVTDYALLEKKSRELQERNVESRNFIMNAALDAIICIDKKGAITFWNPQAEKIFGWKEKEVMGLILSDLIVPPAFRKRHEQGVDRYVKTGHGPALNVLLELTAVNKSKKEFPIELTVLPLKQDGEEFFCGFIRDISARKQQENQLAKLTERLTLATQAISDAIWDWNIKEGKIYRSEGYNTLYGYDFPAQKWPENFWESNVHPDDIGFISARIREVIENAEASSWTGEYRFRKSDGAYAFVKENIIIVREQSGTPIRIVGALQDITKAKEQEQANQKERNLLRAIIDNLPDYVFVKDRELRHVINNQANLRLLGAKTEEETLGKTAADYFAPEIAEIIHQDDLQLFHSGQPIFDREELVETPEGKRIWIKTTKIPLRDEKQEIIGIAGISQDISILYEKEQEQILVQNIITALGKFESIDDALVETLRLIGTFMQFRMGEAWLISMDKKELLRKGGWAEEAIAEIFSYNHRSGFKCGEGFPGIVWQNQQLEVWNDIQVDNKIRRTEQARLAGLNAVVGLPILYKGEVIAVFTFMTDTNITYGESISLLLQQIAVQIALDIQRKKSEDELNRFFNHSPDILCIFGADGYFKKINTTATSLLGYSTQELLSRPYYEFVHPDDQEFTKCAIDKVFNDNVPFYGENRYITKTGDIKWLAWDCIPVEGEKLLYASVKDITEKKGLEEEIVRYNERIGSILESITDGFFAVDKDWEVIYLNREAQSILEVCKNSFLGKKLWDVISQEISEKFTAELHRAVVENRFVQFEEYLPVSDKWYGVNAYPSGTGLSVYLKNITNMVKAKQKLELREQRFRRLIQDGSDLIGILDKEGNYLYVSPSTRQVLGTEPEEYLGKSAFAFIHEDDRERILRYFELLGKEKRIQIEPFRFIDSDKNYRWIETIVTDMTDDPSVGGIVVNSRDVTQRINELNEREKLIEVLTQSNKDLQQFSYITSHNFRAPLSNILGLMQLVEGNPIEDPLLQDILDGLKKSTLVLDETINDLVKVLIIKDSPAVQKEKITFAEVLEKLLMHLKVPLQEASAEVLINTGEAPAVYFNQSYLESIFLNLLTNALKFRSPHRPLKIEISTSRNGKNVVLRFKDNGIGLEVERYKDRLFGLYQRFHDRPDSKGLGLYLIKSQMEALGGDIGIESRVDAGTTFTLTFKNNP